MNEIAKAVNSYHSSQKSKNTSLNVVKDLEEIKKLPDLPKEYKDVITDVQKLTKASASKAHAAALLSEELLSWVENSSPQGKLFSLVYGYQFQFLNDFLIEHENADEIKQVIITSGKLIKTTMFEIESHLRGMNMHPKYSDGPLSLLAKMQSAYRGDDKIGALQSFTKYISNELCPSIEQWIRKADLLLIKQYSLCHSIKEVNPIISDYIKSDPTNDIFKKVAVAALEANKRNLDSFVARSNNGKANLLNTERNKWSKWLGDGRLPKRDFKYYLGLVKDRVN